MGKYNLNIFMIVGGMPFDGDTLKGERSLGGSETAGLCMARELAKRGHYVTMMNNVPQEGEYDGVIYVNINRAVELIQKAPHDVLIVQREPRWLAHNTASKINVLWNHDLATKNFMGPHQGAAWNVDWIFLLSQFHIDQFKSIYSFWDDEHIRKTRNGIDLEDFPKVQKKVPGKVMYCARPERGLINLVAENGIMEKLWVIDKNLKLYVAGYDNTTPHMAQFYQYLWGRCEQLPNIVNLGSLSKKELYQHYAETELYLYPTQFEEISCITAMECLACGVPFVTSDLAALPETLGKGTSIMLETESDFNLMARLPNGYIDAFIGEVLGLLQDKDRRRKMSFQCRKRAKDFSWSGVAEQWEQLFYERFEEASKDKEKLARHFLYFDDVMAARQIAEKDLKIAIDNIYSWTLDENSHKKYYEEFGQTEWQGRPEEHVVRHYDTVFQREVRWDALKNWFREKEIKAGANVLDVGCGPGWFSVGMANEFRVNVLGIEPASTYIDQANILAKSRLKNGAVSFDSECEWWKVKNYFDVIVIGEILEHIGYMEPQDFVEQYEPFLKDDGWLVITTPFGPLRRVAKKRGGMHHELHVRHLEHADIQEMFNKKPGFQIEILYWQNTITTKELCGWYMYSFQKGGEYGEIDLERKLTIQVPRDRLSVCMMAKNEEAIIRKCLNSVEEIADEIILADTGCNDNTASICKEYGANIIQGSDPLQYGFETPRNESIKPATGDWILWIDPDEELQGANNLPKYLRNSTYKGFRIRQHHFSCQPPNATVIDKPVRLFRNLPGVRFWGLIHEHPGFDMNTGMGNVIELADVDIAHAGYYDEPGRRQKFWRNLPNMGRDIEKYPERHLGKWLYMRDLMHLVTWSIEQTGQLNEPARQKCHEIVQLFRNNFLHMGGHMALDGLQYYSGALKLLNKGQEFTWSVGIQNGGRPDNIMTARFADKDDFQAFLAKLLEEKAYMFEGKYRA